MENFSMEMQVRWADLDPNFHLRHSVYYDWGASCRIEFLAKLGFTGEIMQRFQVGPIIFREECIFRKEIRMSDKVSIDLKTIAAKKNYSRFSMQHTIRKNGDIVSAILTVDIAWLDMQRRKLAVLPDELQQLLNKSPIADDFKWLD
jgi:acyl-CoA thioester hydrolase